MPPDEGAGALATSAEGLDYESSQDTPPSPEAQGPAQTREPQEPAQADDEQPPWLQGADETPPWATAPTAPMPAPQGAVPPWQPQPAPAGISFDPALLDTNVTAAREETIKAKWAAQYQAAPTESQRQVIEAQYRAEVQGFRMQVREAELGAREWHMQQQEAHNQALLLPVLRQQRAEQLAAKYQLTTDEVLKDSRGRDIWDPNVMVLLAEERATAKWRARVKGRGSADRPLTAAGGSATGQPDPARMSGKDFEAYRERVRASGGRLLG